MALPSTVHVLLVQLSDVDRGVYESLELRVARHPSESLRFLLTRSLAYCLSFEPGIAFSKGGLSSTDEPPVSVRDPTGALIAWIDVGAPSAERLHRASKSARRVEVYTANGEKVVRETRGRGVFKAEEIACFQIDPALLDALEPLVERRTALELVRTEGKLYVTLGARVLEGTIGRVALGA